MGGYTVPGKRETITDMSRRAVATLEEARVALLDFAIGWDDTTPIQEAADNLSVTGGTVGPLADGTVIEVTRVTWSDIQAELRTGYDWQAPAVVIDAYNARA
jgi:hypothetical protein